MSIFLLQTLILITYFISFLIILLLTFSNKGIYWIIPLFLNIFFILLHAIFIISQNGGNISFSQNVIDLLPKFISMPTLFINAFVFSILWLLLVITFHHAFEKNKTPKDKRKEQMKTNYYGALYSEKIEKRKYNKKIKRNTLRKLYGAKKPTSNIYTEEWANKFDKD
ncbi:MAG: hypothetical protein JJE21_02035 [Spirochaetaceae bacterium]|nr:hypothetical protein [Spirochaetaceae bacterium]